MNRLGRNWQRYALVAFAGVLMIYLFAVPLLQYFLELSASRAAMVELKPPTLFESINQRVIETVVALIFFSFGASLGSFLNVVAYRMPLKKSVISQSSFCPNCKARIAAQDNLPVFGWLLLGGQCRNCQTPISARYPIVEGIVGLIFLLLYFIELISGGANLPLRETNYYRGVVWVLMNTKWDLVALYVYHCSWLVFLMIWTLFAWDGSRFPKRTILLAVVSLSLAPVFLTYLNLVPFDYLGGQTRLFLHLQTRTAISLLVGAGAGIAAACWLTSAGSSWMGGFRNGSPETLRESTQSFRQSVFASLVTTGITVGWQALTGILLISLIWRALSLLDRTGRLWGSLPFAGWFLAAAILHHSLWRQIFRLW